MTPLQQQFEVLRAMFGTASLQPLPSGAALVGVENFPLPPGWSKQTTRIRFLAPVGYPFGKPDCFWADPDLRLANGNIPMNTGMQAIPEVGETPLWFSWHIGQWNPNRDSLLTYVRVIENRLRDPR